MDLASYYEGLSSERLTFRKLARADIPDWIEFYHDNPSLEYLNIDLNRPVEVMARAWVEEQIGRYEREEFGQLAMIRKDTGEFIGTRGFKYCLLDGKRPLESAGAVKPRFWRQGYGSESLTCFLRYAFNSLGADQVVSRTHPRNVASLANQARRGFAHVDIRLTEGRLAVLQQITRQDWERLWDSERPETVR